MWQKAGERQAYLACFEEFGGWSVETDHVALEPFGADMGSWLRKVGFVLSPSTSESFHLAPVEGMASGSIPIVSEVPEMASARSSRDRFIVSDNDAAVTFMSDTSAIFSAPCCRS